MAVTTVVIGCADQALSAELQFQLEEAAQIEVLARADTTTELVELVLRHEPDIVVVHSDLGPDPAGSVVRDLGLRRPGTAAVMLAPRDPAVFESVMASGARAVITLPLAFADVQAKISGAVEWSRSMRAALGAGSRADGGRSHGVVLALAGAKGGLGTTTIAVHLALAAARRDAGRSVIVVDLDLENGDVGSLLDAKARTSIADLAKVADDLSARAVADSVVSHESGLDLLLVPDDVREVEAVTAPAIRRVLAMLRQAYDLVVIDVGSRVTPVQAAVVEMADEVIEVVGPDLLSLRALRRTSGWWESLGARKAESVQVLLNRADRIAEIQPDAVRRLSPSPVLPVILPDLGKRLERAANSRNPDAVSDPTWLRGIGGVLDASGVLRTNAAPEPARATRSREAPTRQRGRGRRRGASSDAGQVSLEFVGTLPAVLLLVALLWQSAVVGLSFVWAGHGAAAAAQQTRTWHSDAVVAQAARDAVPSAWDGVSTSVTWGTTRSDVSVAVPVPVLLPGVLTSGWHIDVTRRVVMEP